MKVEDVPDEWRQVARVAFTKAFASTDGTCALDAALAAVIPAIQAEALERAAGACNASAQRAEDISEETVAWALDQQAAAIRALKEGT